MKDFTTITIKKSVRNKLEILKRKNELEDLNGVVEMLIECEKLIE